MEVCGSCGEAFAITPRTKVLLCLKCRSYIKRRDFKLKALKEKGGKCIICSYNKYEGALSFHHYKKDSNKKTIKSFNISSAQNKPWDQVQEELQHVVVLCCNCHAEVHADISEIPV